MTPKEFEDGCIYFDGEKVYVGNQSVPPEYANRVTDFRDRRQFRDREGIPDLLLTPTAAKVRYLRHTVDISQHRPPDVIERPSLSAVFWWGVAIGTPIGMLVEWVWHG